MCHYLEGIKDALSECSGLVSQNSGVVCKNMEAVEIEIHSRARGEKRLSAACWQARLPSFSRSKRYGSCSLSYHTCFKSLVASMFVQGSYICIYFKQRKWTASNVGCGYIYGLTNWVELHSVCICACANDFSARTLVLRNNPKTKGQHNNVSFATYTSFFHSLPIHIVLSATLPSSLVNKHTCILSEYFLIGAYFLPVVK